MNSLCSCFLVLLTSYIQTSSSVSIFLIANLPSGSHAIWYNKLADVLAQRGHEVVMLGVGPFKLKSENITAILIEDGYGWLKTVEKILEESSLVEMVNGFGTPSDNIKAGSDWSLSECKKFLKSKGTKSFMEKYKNKHFDLIITDFACDSFLGFVNFFGNPPFIIATPYNNAYNIYDSVGLFDNPSYVPSPFSPFEPEMDLKERAINLYYKIYGMYLWNRYNFPRENVLAREVFGSSTSDVEDILRNVSLLLVGNDPVLTPAKPLPPAYIPVGGFHIDKVKPLPKDLKTFMDDAKEGVIYFSFGSNFKSIFMTPNMIDTFLETFKELPYRVVWKLERNESSDIPSNVLISKWLPQNDILAHPKVRCFISHGGLLGTQESIYHGVPVLGLPFMFDQLDVVNKLQTNGVGIRLEFPKLTKSYIKKNIQEIMKSNYRQKMHEWSRVFKDTPQTPEERAIWWIEYVIRNPSETQKYLRSSTMHLYWFQRLMLDVVAIVLIPSLIILYLTLYLVRIIFSKCCKTNKNAKYLKKNKRE